MHTKQIAFVSLERVLELDEVFAFVVPFGANQSVHELPCREIRIMSSTYEHACMRTEACTL